MAKVCTSRRVIRAPCVHGMSAHLGAMLAAMGAASAGEAHLTLLGDLGDLGDRGPDSLGCYRAALGRTPSGMGFSGRTCLLGNHEMFMLAVM